MSLSALVTMPIPTSGAFAAVWACLTLLSARQEAHKLVRFDGRWCASVR